MTIAPALLRAYPAMNEAQRAIVAHDQGPLLVIAGPGSGKTFSLVLRGLNLLLLDKATPRELALCTFTGKAAFELRDRFAAAARKVGYTKDLSELRVSTIHGLCNRLLTTYRHHTPLGNNYETLDELTQLLFLFDHFDQIVARPESATGVRGAARPSQTPGMPQGDRYLGKWKTKWTAIEGIRGYFDKITEELVDPDKLAASPDPFLGALGTAYKAYREALFANNRLDFGHQQKLVHNLLLDRGLLKKITAEVKYVLVDEYQDTNYIQEQILLKLTAKTRNLCVVGDEDQSMRLHYVAFSRPERVLVLTAHSQPKDYFAPIWQGLPQWPYVQKDLLGAQNFSLKDRMPVKRTFSFTGDLKIYETCPRQYQFFREYDFTPSRSAVIFFGLLVHQTIEEIHRLVMDGQLPTLNETRLRALFDRTFSFLCLADVRPIGKAAREAAFTQVLNYFRQNQDEMKRVIQTEVDVSVEKEGYILAGKVDLLLGGDGKLELLDFKTSPRPAHSPELLASYERQLCTYAHILEKRHGKRPDRLLLYWTAEPKKKDALMEFPYRPQLVQQAGRYFDSVVGKIMAKDFQVLKPPEPGICKECDFRHYCKQQGTIA